MIDTNKPLENPELVAAIEAMQNDPTPENESAFLKLLPDAQFLMLLRGDFKKQMKKDKGGNATLKEGATLSFPMVVDEEDNPLHFGFTDWKALKASNSKPGQQTIAVPFRDLPGIVLREGSRSTGFIINPGTQDVFIAPELLAHFAGTTAAAPQGGDGATTVEIGLPAENPDALTDAVEEAAAKLPEVKQIWLVLMEKQGEMMFLLIVDAEGDMNAVFGALHTVAAPHAPKGIQVGLVPYETEFGRSAAADKIPFYQKL